MKDKYMKKWEKYRKKGKKRAIFEIGVLQFGVGVAILNTITFYIIHPEEPWRFRLIYNLIYCPIAGIFMGLFSWYWTEKQYNNEIRKRQLASKKENQSQN